MIIVVQCFKPSIWWRPPPVTLAIENRFRVLVHATYRQTPGRDVPRRSHARERQTNRQGWRLEEHPASSIVPIYL